MFSLPYPLPLLLLQRYNLFQFLDKIVEQGIGSKYWGEFFPTPGV